MAHSHFLRICSRIGRVSVGVQSALVHDSDTVLIPVLAVSTNHLIRTPILDGAVATDNLMVATAILETTLEVPDINFVKATLLPRKDSRAVNDD